MLIDVIIFSRDRELELTHTLERLSKSSFRTVVFHNNHKALKIPKQWMNIEYQLCKGKDYSARAAIAKSHLESEYSLICSDDDGLVESQLMKMKSALQKNQDLSSVGGVAVGAFPYAGIVTGSIAYPEMRRYSNRIEATRERIQHHLLQGGSGGIPRAGMYRLFRKKSMEDILTAISLCGRISTPYIYEVVTEIITAWSGGTMYLETPYWIRNWQTQAISRKDWNRSFNFSSWWGNKKYVDENRKLVDAVRSITNLEDHFLVELIDGYTRKRTSVEKNPRRHNNLLGKGGSLIKQQILKRYFEPKLPLEIGQVLSRGIPGLTTFEINEVKQVAYEMFLDTEKIRP